MIRALLILLSLGFPVLSFAAEEKLCLGEVCLGDGINELMGIKWKTVYLGKNGRDGKYYFNQINETLVADANTAKFLARLESRWEFDGNVLKALNNVRGYCTKVGFKGTFVSRSGNETWVTLNPLFSGNGANQKLAVVSITRFFRKITDKQKVELEREIASRYGSHYGNYTPGQPHVSFLSSGWAGEDRMLTLDLNDHEMTTPQYVQKLKDFPGCTRPVQLD